MNEEKINKLFDRMSPTKEQREKMFDKIINPEETRKKIRFKKIPAIIAVAAVFVMSTVTVYATNTFGIADFLGKVFDGGETLETSTYIPLTEKTSTNADIDVNVSGVIASESSVNVIVELSRKDGKDFPENIRFLNENFDINPNEYGYGLSRSHFQTDGNKAVAVYNLNICGQSVDGIEATLTLADLCDEKNEVFVDGEWSVTFDVKSTLMPTALKEKTTDEGIIINAELTPLSISATFENIPEKYYQNEDPLFNGYMPSHADCCIVLKDGRKIKATGGAGAAYNMEEHKTDAEFTFDTVIDINEVDYVLIVGEKLEIMG